MITAHMPMAKNCGGGKRLASPRHAKGNDDADKQREDD